MSLSILSIFSVVSYICVCACALFICTTRDRVKRFFDSLTCEVLTIKLTLTMYHPCNIILHTIFYTNI